MESKLKGYFDTIEEIQTELQVEQQWQKHWDQCIAAKENFKDDSKH